MSEAKKGRKKTIEKSLEHIRGLTMGEKKKKIAKKERKEKKKMKKTSRVESCGGRKKEKGGPYQRIVRRTFEVDRGKVIEKCESDIE